ncbi:MAG: bifunctional 5,10-methylenetetrahydrofolate dehydrogenase/5,10-methenyltetrahydrofolate cyclohydrolase, partial [Gammaproteobacteria bacterium]
PNKDVDGFTVRNVGLLHSNRDCIEPSTPKGVMILVKKVLGDNLSGKKAVVIGRSLIVGRPMASMLLKEDCTVTILHSKSYDIIEECKSADILISAVGNPEFIDEKYIKPGACVIDVGITRVEGKIKGDVNFESVSKVAGFVTPVPGGVGPMTVACMLENTVRAACKIKGIKLAA